MRSFKEFQEEFNTPIYSRRDMAIAIEKAIKDCVVNRVIQKKEACDVALQILAVHDYPGVGRTIIVK